MRQALVILLLTLCLPVTDAFSCSKLLRWNDDPPFTFANPKNPETVQGISVDITKLIFAKLGCELKLLKMPWARALLSLETGQIDMLSGAFNTPERREYAYFSEQDIYSPNILFIRREDKGKWQLKALKDILDTSFRLGVQINVVYSQEFQTLKESPAFARHLHENSSRISLWQMLNLKRIDGVIADQFTGLIELKKLGLDQAISADDLVISYEPSYFAFSKKTTHREFVEQFDQVFRSLIAQGEIKKIEQHYLQ